MVLLSYLPGISGEHDSHGVNTRADEMVEWEANLL
jgi:hypothetical protein